MQDVLKNKAAMARALSICLGKKVHFAAYKLPGKSGITLIVQKDPNITALGKLTSSLPKKGFLIAPFSQKENEAYLIKPDIVLRGEADSWQIDELNALPHNAVNDTHDSFPEDTVKADYISLIQESIGKINAGEFEKVVLSRVKSIPGNYTSHLGEIFQNLV